MSLPNSRNRIVALSALCLLPSPDRLQLRASLSKLVSRFPYLWTGHLMLNVIWHVGRIAMHRHVHGHIDTHAGEHVVVLCGWLDRSCSPRTKHSTLVLRPRAILRGSVATTGRHHLQPVDHIDHRNCTFVPYFFINTFCSIQPLVQWLSKPLSREEGDQKIILLTISTRLRD